VVVDDEDEDYDRVDDEEDYEDEEEYDEEDEEGEEEEDGEEVDQHFGSSNISQPQQPSLFTNFKTANPQSINFNKINLNENNPVKPPQGANLFSNMIKNNQLLTTVQQFDAFVVSPTLENLRAIDEATLKTVTEVIITDLHIQIND
jgi:hypothetical protein